MMKESGSDDKGDWRSRQAEFMKVKVTVSEIYVKVRWMKVTMKVNECDDEGE